MTGPLLLLDGASLWFRAYYALPDSITSPDGRSVNAVRGFTDMVAALITKHQPSRLAVCLDLDWRPAFRVEAVPTYKAHRVAEDTGGAEEEVPDTLSPQVPMILDVLAATGIATAGAEGLEADDVLGTLAAIETRDTTIVVTGDRDLLQVVTDAPVPVRVLYVVRGLAKAELLGPEEVAAKYGVPADRAGEAYAELALLRGDSSDGLPGVKGIGEKTASSLICSTDRSPPCGPPQSIPNPTWRRVRARNSPPQPTISTRHCRWCGWCGTRMSNCPAKTRSRRTVDADRLGRLAEELGIENSVGRLTAAMKKVAAARVP